MKGNNRKSDNLEAVAGNDNRSPVDGVRGQRHEENSSSQGKGTTRRDFLASTASFGAGLIVTGKATAQEGETSAAPSAAPAAPPKIKRKGPNEELRVALIGVGAQGRELMGCILNIPKVRIVAVCDIWAGYNRKRAVGTLKKYGYVANEYEDYREMLDAETDLDAAVIATPDFMHAEHAIACMKAGLDVYCEKEMSNDLAKAREMVLTSRRTGRLLQIGHQRRSNPRYHHAIDKLILKTGLLGRVTQGFAQWNRAKSDDQLWPQKYEIDPDTLEKYRYDSMHHFRNWRWYRKYGGGPIVDLGSHQIDLFSWVWGVNPKAVTADGGIDFYPQHEWYDNVMAIFEYENEQGVARAFYQVLTTTSHGGFYETFMGEDGALVISEVPQMGNEALREVHAQEWEPFVKQGLLLQKAVERPATEKTTDVTVDVRVSPRPGSWGLPVQLNKPAHQPHLENFFDAIRLGAALNCPAEIGYETAVAVLKVNEAVEAGGKIHFAPEEFEV